ncbi:MAG TPA: hypothetical protein VEH04_09400 [Verrucomicrobiae bacterium]|nr:hypothetical protein [Verrucomicrobiae bacterium]
MSLAGSKSRLATLTKDLWMQWHETREAWRDAKALEFEKDYMQELFISVDRTITAMEKVDDLLAKVRKDCE